MDGPLERAIDRLYQAFAPVPRPAAIEVCPCCHTADEYAALLAPGPLRNLPIPLLADYASDALLTVGGLDDFRYFLPRILQIAVADGFEWPDPEVVIARLRVAGWTTWPPGQQWAVRDVLQALWRQTLVRYPSRPDLDAVLCAIGGAEDDLGPYLDGWAAALASGAAPPAQHLRDLLNWSARSTGDRWRLTNAFWNHRDAPVGDWLAAGTTRATIRAGFDVAGSEPALAALAEAAGLLGA